MKNLPWAALALLLLLSVAVATQNSNTNSKANVNNSSNANKNGNGNRGPIFGAAADQIKKAQAILKQRGFYNGEQTGMVDADTRASCKIYQQADGLKGTGTLNNATIEKITIDHAD